MPVNIPSLDHVADPTFPSAQSGPSSLDLDEYNSLEPALGHTIEDDKVHRAAEEADVFGIVREIRKIGDELFVHFTSSDCLTPLHCVPTNSGGVAEPPNQKVRPCDKNSGCNPDQETGQIGWQGEAPRTTSGVKLRGLRVERLTVRYRSGTPQCVLDSITGLNLVGRGRSG